MDGVDHMYEVLLPVQIMHELGAMADPLRERLLYRPWLNMDGATEESSMDDCASVPLRTSVPRANAALTVKCMPMCFSSQRTAGARALPSNLPSTVSMTMPHGASRPLGEAHYSKDAVVGCVMGNHPHATQEEKKALESVVRKKKDAFAYSMTELVGYKGPVGDFTLNLQNDKPIITRRRPQSALQQEIVEKKCCELRDEGLIIRAPALCQYASALVLPAKKDANGEWTEVRMCVDYRPINAVTVVNHYGMPKADEIFHAVRASKHFSKVDMRAGFHQIPVLPADRPKTAFWWGHQLWMFTRMPFGLTNATAQFQTVMETLITRAGLTHCALAFVDDLLIHSATAEAHIQDVDKVMDMLLSCGLRAHPDKSVFGADTVEYLGHLVSSYGLHPTQAKVAAILNLAAPTNVSELRSVLGLLNYYREYCIGFSTIAQPLNNLLGKGVAWVWTTEHDTAYERLKQEICAEGKALKRYDPQRPLLLYTDWSGLGVGGVLGQPDGDAEYIVACVSRSLNVHERNYSAFKGELLAMVFAIKSMEIYLHGVAFTLVTDHQALQWLMTTPNLTGQQARWALMLQAFDFTIQHRPGVRHQNADVPSRFPQVTTVDVTGARLDEEGEVSLIADIHRTHEAHATRQAMLTSRAQMLSLQALAAQPYVALHSAELAPTGFELDNEAQQGAKSTTQYGTSWPSEAKNRITAMVRRVKQLHFETCSTVVSPPKQQSMALAQGPCDAFGVGAVHGLIQTTMTPNFWLAARTEGITLFEPFGGMCAGLDMVLRNGGKIIRYLYVDKDPAVQLVALHRITQLMAMYPDLLPPSAVQRTMSALPQDVLHIGSKELLRAGVRDGTQWLVVAGWECQDLSPAGSRKGLAGPRSGTFYPLLQLLGSMQVLQDFRSPAFLVENTYFQGMARHNQELSNDYERVNEALGRPVCIDAAVTGSGAHRLRNIWTNLACTTQLQHWVDSIVRPPQALDAQQLLDPGRSVNLCGAVAQPPYAQVNVAGAPVRVMPTLVAFPQSYAFRNGGNGVISTPRGMDEPNADERERMLGYPCGATAAPGTSETTRRQILGRSMDANMLLTIYMLSQQQGDTAPLGTTCPKRSKGIDAWVNQVLRQQHMEPAYSSLPPATQMMLNKGWQPGTPLGSKPGRLDALVEPLTTHSNQLGTRHGLGYTALVTTCQGVGTSCMPHRPATAYLAACGALVTVNGPEQEEMTLSREAEMQDEAVSASHGDIWEDKAVLTHLKAGVMPAGASKVERDRVRRRARAYAFEDEVLVRRMADKTTRVVPKPEARLQLIKEVHEQGGHFGAMRTTSLLQPHTWWQGMAKDVRDAVRQCGICDRTNAAFNLRSVELNPLPIRGLMYR